MHTQTPPCRSFCVQIAEVCANDYNYFLNICWEISCPPTETYCTPDPYIGAQVVSAGIGCQMPFYDNPYAKSAAGPKSTRNIDIGKWFVVFLTIFVIGVSTFILRKHSELLGKRDTIITAVNGDR